MKDIFIFCSECKNECEGEFLGITGTLDNRLSVGYKYVCQRCNREVAVIHANAEKIQFTVSNGIIEVIK